MRHSLALSTVLVALGCGAAAQEDSVPPCRNTPAVPSMSSDAGWLRTCDDAGIMTVERWGAVRAVTASTIELRECTDCPTVRVNLVDPTFDLRILPLTPELRATLRFESDSVCRFSLVLTGADASDPSRAGLLFAAGEGTDPLSVSPLMLSWTESDLRVVIEGRADVLRVANGEMLVIATPGTKRQNHYRVENLRISDTCGARLGWRVSRID